MWAIYYRNSYIYKMATITLKKFILALSMKVAELNFNNDMILSLDFMDFNCMETQQQCDNIAEFIAQNVSPVWTSNKSCQMTNDGDCQNIQTQCMLQKPYSFNAIPTYTFEPVTTTESQCEDLIHLRKPGDIFRSKSLFNNVNNTVHAVHGHTVPPNLDSARFTSTNQLEDNIEAKTQNSIIQPQCSVNLPINNLLTCHNNNCNTNKIMSANSLPSIPNTTQGPETCPNFSMTHHDSSEYLTPMITPWSDLYPSYRREEMITVVSENPPMESYKEYLERRQKNNAASRRSRKSRRQKETLIREEVRKLREENAKLKEEIARLKSERHT